MLEVEGRGLHSRRREHIYCCTESCDGKLNQLLFFYAAVAVTAALQVCSCTTTLRQHESRVLTSNGNFQLIRCENENIICTQPIRLSRP